VTLAVDWPVVHHDFVNYDDDCYVTQNRQVQAGLTWHGLAWAFGHVHGDFTYWHPLTWVSHMADCQLFGLNPAGHHLVNLLLHALNSLLVFLVFRRLTGAFWRSALLAALFALHPLQVDTVAWVAERKNLLSATFFLLTVGAYGRYAGTRSPKPRAEIRSPKAETRKKPEGRSPKPEVGSAAQTAVPSSRFKVQRSMLEVRRSKFEVARSGSEAPSSSTGADLTQRREDPQRAAENSLSLRSSAFLCGSALKWVWYLLTLLLFACGLMCKPVLVTLPFVLLLLDFWPLRRNAEGRMMNDEVSHRNSSSSSSSTSSSSKPPPK